MRLPLARFREMAAPDAGLGRGTMRLLREDGVGRGSVVDAPLDKR